MTSFDIAGPTGWVFKETAWINFVCQRKPSKGLCEGGEEKKPFNSVIYGSFFYNSHLEMLLRLGCSS